MVCHRPHGHISCQESGIIGLVDLADSQRQHSLKRYQLPGNKAVKIQPKKQHASDIS